LDSWGEEAASVMKDFWKTIDTAVMGRKTYEPVLKSGTPFPIYSGVKNYVFSHTIRESPDENVQIIREDAAEFVTDLKDQEGKDIMVLGGGELAKSLFEANLIDEIGMNIHPGLLGSGIPLFHDMKNQITLELIECRTFKNGCVLVSYRVNH
jgi:dihydrofolate reductase